ncbi:hypothetical protein LB572_28995 [Mesorhizobium sp. BH1-1-5]|uniref:hypothetical protein n=1 Tax=unclassified Mesorhizobium TaxID=325217 RepID=UPI001AED47C3|nr:MULTISPECIES: hypothetical protein [unclassified Mesorhizobium]MBZ9991140.1 hypothetical protein [Mesorhizobium sp. BH1-1-5]
MTTKIDQLHAAGDRSNLQEALPNRTWRRHVTFMQTPINMNTVEATGVPDCRSSRGTQNEGRRFHGPIRSDSMFNPWIDLSLSVLEAQQVILLRTIRLAEGGKRAELEAKRMMSEKIEAAGRAGAMIAIGASADRIARFYGNKIRANRRRLSR